MRPGWDLLQDLRGGKPAATSPKDETRPDEASREVRAVTSETTILANAIRLRGLTDGIKEGKRMSLLGKLQHLTEEAQSFNTETEQVLDGISEKIKLGRARRDIAKDKHHAYYDGIIAGVEESVTVIDRLSNGPLPEDGK